MKACFLYVAMVAAGTLHGQGSLERVSGDAEATVIVFLALDCPVSQKYIPTLNRVCESYEGRPVRLYSIIPGGAKKRDLKKFLKEYRICFAAESDRQYAWVRLLSAKATPEAFVFNKERMLVYRGAVDNWFYELGGYRKEPTKHYLVDAIEAALAGKTPQVQETKALGCYIEVPEK